MAECSGSIVEIMRFYGNETHEGAHIPFNRELIGRIRNQSTAYDYKNTLEMWLEAMPKERTPNWLVGVVQCIHNLCWLVDYF